jgi:hypothetical protein
MKEKAAGRFTLKCDTARNPILVVQSSASITHASNYAARIAELELALHAYTQLATILPKQSTLTSQFCSTSSSYRAREHA